jgi:hypothetical protein
MLSGFCSRHQIKNYSHGSKGEDFVTYIASSAVPRLINLQDLVSATAHVCTDIYNFRCSNQYMNKATCAGDGSFYRTCLNEMNSWCEV